MPRTVAPRSSNGWALLGEAGKWVGVSQRRFASVGEATGGGLLVHCQGVAGERIQLLEVPPGASQAVAVWHTFDASGAAAVRIVSGGGALSWVGHARGTPKEPKSRRGYM